MAIEWNKHFATLYRDFLAAAPVESGIPASLPKRIPEDTAKLKRPFIVVECEAKESSHRSEFKGHVIIRYGIKLKEDSEEPAEAAAVLAAIVTRLADEAAWRDFIQAKPLTERTGWSIMFRNALPSDTETDEAERTRDHLVKIALHAVCPR